MILKVIIIFSVVLSASGQKPLCSFKKSPNTSCFCFHEKRSEFPILSADCSRLSFREHPKDNQLLNVHNLDLSHNDITILDVEKNNFESAILISLNLAFNQIELLSPDFFKSIPNLEDLDLSNNKLINLVNSNIFRGSTKLTKLNLSFNQLSTLPEGIFSHVPNLKELDLSYNYFGALLVDSNDFFNPRLGVPIGITSLKLDGLEIEKLHYAYFERAHGLKSLSLADNRFKRIPTVPYTLDYLDVSGNPIMNVTANRLNYHSLKILKLNRLGLLKVIDRYAFYNLQALEELHLSDCAKLKEFNDLAFGVVSNDMELSLRQLYLARNGIRSLNSTYLKLLSKLDRLDLQHNPWKCDCNILWLKELDGLLDKDVNMICVSPSNMINRNIMNLTMEDMAEYTVTKNNKQKIMITILGLLIIILTILIIYLIYLGPFYTKNKYKGIGPQSPYQNNTIGIIPIQAENFRINE